MALFGVYTMQTLITCTIYYYYHEIIILNQNMISIHTQAKCRTQGVQRSIWIIIIIVYYLACMPGAYMRYVLGSFDYMFS